MTDEQIIRLVLELAGQDKAAQLAAALGRVDDEAEQAADGVGKLDDAAKKIAPSVDKATGSTRNLGRAGLETGRIVQDFAQGGLGGIINNIEGATLALGLGSGLAGVLTLVGVAALTAGPAVKSFLSGLLDGVNEVPEATDSLESLTEAIKKNAKELDALKEKQSLTNSELERFGVLTREAINLEKQQEQARAAAALAKKVDALTDPVSAEAARARAAELQDSLGGDQARIKAAARLAASIEPNEVVDAARAKVEAEYEEKFRLQLAAPNNRFLQAKQGRAIEAAEKALKAAEAERDRQANAMVDKAIGEGDLDAFNKLRAAATKRPVDFGAGTVAALENASPERVAADAEFERENARATERRKERDAKARAAREAETERLNAEAEELTRQGQAIERLADQGVKADEAKDREADRQAEARQREADQRGRALAGLVSANTGIDEEAAQRAGQLRAGGMSEEDIAARLAPQIAARIRRDSGGRVGAEDAGLAGQALAENAARTGTALMLQQGQAGLQNQAGIIGAMGGMAQGAQGLLDQQMAQAQAIRQMRDLIQEVNRGVQANKGVLLRRGR